MLGAAGVQRLDDRVGRPVGKKRRPHLRSEKNKVAPVASNMAAMAVAALTKPNVGFHHHHHY
jgi:hypothetical protein